MGTMTSQITSFMIVYSTIYSGADQTGFYTKGRPLVKSNLICPSDKLSWQPGCPVSNINIDTRKFLYQPRKWLFGQPARNLSVDPCQRKHQRPASLAFVRGFHRWPVNSRHKGPVTRKMFLFDDIMFDHSLYLRTGGTEHPHPTTEYPHPLPPPHPNCPANMT